ncbi:MAG TPA: hypothetical protein VG452_10745 [Egibacteraceae bacterium]|nr:hypothetical protein [Egibacteraceae bacterium]
MAVVALAESALRGSRRDVAATLFDAADQLDSYRDQSAPAPRAARGAAGSP